MRRLGPSEDRKIVTIYSSNRAKPPRGRSLMALSGTLVQADGPPVQSRRCDSAL